MSSIIEQNHVQIGVTAADWREAIRAAGDLLVRIGCIGTKYIDNMIRAVEEMGPYIVILPGFALAHAAPCADVFRDAMSLITLTSPVEFGSAENDPVQVVLCLSCVDRKSHMASLQRIAMALMEDGVVEQLANATSIEEIQAILSDNSSL